MNVKWRFNDRYIIHSYKNQIVICIVSEILRIWETDLKSCFFLVVSSNMFYSVYCKSI